jgi:hypothetical protein
MSSVTFLLRAWRVGPVSFSSHICQKCQYKGLHRPLRISFANSSAHVDPYHKRRTAKSSPFERAEEKALRIRKCEAPSKSSMRNVTRCQFSLVHLSILTVINLIVCQYTEPEQVK